MFAGIIGKRSLSFCWGSWVGRMRPRVVDTHLASMWEKPTSDWRQEKGGQSQELERYRLVTTLYCCCCLVDKSCLTLWGPMDCSLPGSFVYGIFLGKITEVGCHFLLQGSSQPRDQTCIFCLLHLLQWQVNALPLSHQGSPWQLHIHVLIDLGSSNCTINCELFNYFHNFQL